MNFEKKYNLGQTFADIEEDIADQQKDVSQEIDISQPAITNLVLEKTRKRPRRLENRTTNI